MTNLVFCFLSLLAMSNCLTISSDSTTASATTTTTEAPVELLIMEEEDKLDDADTPDTTVEEKEGQDSAKSKRTLEGFLGYGYNDISRSADGVRFNRQLPGHGKLRAYFTQPAPQHAYRYYSGHLVGGPGPQEDYSPRSQPIQAEAQHQRPYTTIPLPSTNNADLGVPPEYLKAAYQQQQQQFSYHSVPGNALTPSLPQTAPVFGPAHHSAGAFYSLPALSSPQLFSNANPFLALTQGHNFLLPHSGNSGLALLQNPSSPYGPQIIPVIILRVAPGVEHPALHQQQHHQQQSAAFLQAPAGYNLLYHQPQRVVENPQQSSNQNQQQHITYQSNPKTQHLYTSQKTVYKKPVAPTQAPSTDTQKPRKNIIVVNEQPDSHSELPYTQYKYASYKEKA